MVERRNVVRPTHFMKSKGVGDVHDIRTFLLSLGTSYSGR